MSHQMCFFSTLSSEYQQNWLLSKWLVYTVHPTIQRWIVVQANTETDIIMSILIEDNGSLDKGRLAGNLQEEWLTSVMFKY